MFKPNHFLAVVGIILLSLVGVATFVQKPVLAQTVTFTPEMHGTKNLTHQGTIHYYIRPDAGKYQKEIRTAVAKWNRALGRPILQPGTDMGTSRLVFTATNHLDKGYAGMAEINSGVIALNRSWMSRYNGEKKQAVVIHELGHTFGTRDLYDYSNPSLRAAFRKHTIMGGSYSTRIQQFDVKLAKWSLANTRSMSQAEFNGYRSNPGLYYQQMLHGKL
ncbi:hypothetical protein GQR93_05360 [Lentilactobacillus hilgardii]|uniref:Snapalysin n=1 Tax=Lentilactobacillus hilgardii TaxID=1588 RepID=A0A6P1E2Y5_LENHI|nr:zinc-dependent metalloprotease family protein [Lentilactobacillus hilgardii]QHB51686.1 hypothetical protein GQR93_05360 [Lentilactobacillus hilgardii]